MADKEGQYSDRLAGAVPAKYVDMGDGTYALRSLADAPKLTQAFDFDGSGNLIYHGEAPMGTSKATAGWRIQKFTYSGDNMTDAQFADGDRKFDNVWNNRASLSYS